MCENINKALTLNALSWCLLNVLGNHFYGVFCVDSEWKYYDVRFRINLPDDEVQSCFARWAEQLIKVLFLCRRDSSDQKSNFDRISSLSIKIKMKKFDCTASKMAASTTIGDSTRVEIN